MRVLLDTNIIIHRENRKVSNYSVGHLFRWLDKLKHDKIVHPLSVSEIQKYHDPEVQEAFAVKLGAYNILQSTATPTQEFISRTGAIEKTENDRIDNCLLYEVALGHVDLLITEDRRLRNKATRLGLSNKVFSIDTFISLVSAENPELIEYKMLAVKKECFGTIDINDPFFDSFKVAYPGFERWFMSKCDEEAYVCRNDTNNVLGFLYLKTEGLDENYADIEPTFAPKKRLKVGTFKVESTGFRLGERFMKIIFDNALQRNVDEIYVTLFTDRGELRALYDLAVRWGFCEHGRKITNGKEELVLVKTLKQYNPHISVRENFPNLRGACNKYIVPIYPQYHTTLLPDSKLNNENEIDFVGREPHRYALQKVYISWAPCYDAKPGDIVLFYRTGPTGTNKKYTSVVTTVAVVDEIIQNFASEDDFLRVCQNRSVFSTEELKSFWRDHRWQLKVLKFIFVKSLIKRPTLGQLWDAGIIQPPGGPRSFTKISEEHFKTILSEAQTSIAGIE